MKEEYKRHFRGTLWSALGLIPGQIRGIILIPILTKLLGVSFYGKYVLVLTVISLISGLSDLGLGMSLSRFLPSVKDTDEGAKTFYSVFWATFLINGIVFFIVGVVGSYLATYFHLPPGIAFHIAAAVALYSMYGVVIEFYRACEFIRTYVLLGGARNVAEIVVVAVTAIFTRDLTRVVDGMAMLNFIALVGIYLSIRSRVGRVHGPDDRVKKLLSFSLPLVPGRVADWVVNLSDRFLIGLFLGEFAVGIYNPGYALGSLILVVPTILVTMLPPLLSRLYDTGKLSIVDDIVIYTLKYFLIVAIPTFFGLIVISKQLLLVLSNQIIAEQGYVIPPIVALGAVLYGCSQILLQVLQVRLRTKRIAVAALTGAAVNLILNLLLIRTFGIVAAAVTTTVAFGISFIVVLQATGLSISTIARSTRFVNILVSGLTMALILLVAHDGLANTLLLEMVFGVLSYSVCGVAFGVLDERERRHFNGMMKRLIFKPGRHEGEN